MTNIQESMNDSQKSRINGHFILHLNINFNLLGVLNFKINLPRIRGFFINMNPVNLNFHKR